MVTFSVEFIQIIQKLVAFVPEKAAKTKNFAILNMQVHQNDQITFRERDQGKILLMELNVILKSLKTAN